jgi:AbiV family abortive infection protein
LIEFVKQLKEIGFVIRLGPHEEEQHWMKSVSGRALMDKILKDTEFMGALGLRIQDSADGSFMAEVQKKELNKLKQKCMYVDLDETLQVLADPADITQGTANFFLRLAHRVIGRYRSSGTAEVRQ